LLWTVTFSLKDVYVILRASSSGDDINNSLTHTSHNYFNSILSYLQKEIKKHVMSAALKKGVSDGSLIKIKASYKLAPDAKKAMTAKPKKAAPKKKKAAAPKKKTTKKKAVKKPSSKKKTTKKKITVKAKATTKKSTKKAPAKKKTATKKKAATKKK